MNWNTNMRVWHRYLGFFLAGIMGIYALSGIVLIFRNTDFLKKEVVVERTLNPGLLPEQLGKEIGIRDLKLDREEGDLQYFKQGNYNKVSGAVVYSTKKLPAAIEKLTHLHKATTKDPLFFLNIFFGAGLFFFVISSFWMFMPGSKIFRKGLYFTLAGVVLTIIMLLF